MRHSFAYSSLMRICREAQDVKLARAQRRLSYRIHREKRLIARIPRKIEPVCMAALSLWCALACGGNGSWQIWTAGILQAFVISVCQSLVVIRDRSARDAWPWSALCVGFALGGGVLQFQSQQNTLSLLVDYMSAARTEAETPASRISENTHQLSLFTLEGRLAIDSQMTSRKNRMLSLEVQAAEYESAAMHVRLEWKRPIGPFTLLTGAGPRLWARTPVRLENARRIAPKTSPTESAQPQAKDPFLMRFGLTLMVFDFLPIGRSADRKRVLMHAFLARFIDFV